MITFLRIVHAASCLIFRLHFVSFTRHLHVNTSSEICNYSLGLAVHVLRHNVFELASNAEVSSTAPTCPEMFRDCPVFLTQLSQPWDTMDSPGLSQVLSLTFHNT